MISLIPMATGVRDGLTPGYTSEGSDPLVLPDPPVVLQDTYEAAHVLRILQSLHKTDPDCFARVFCSPDGSEAPEWNEHISEISRLRKLQILRQSEDDRLRSAYLIMPWAGAFYLSDFPGRGHPFEVFSPHVETRFFAKLLQVHPRDKVLDLGTGSGILLLEAARHGATGVGVDISDRAIQFARANAALNGFSDQQIHFQKGDITDTSAYGDWNNPDIVLCNPPFEPVPDDPGFPKRPVHSDGGPYGTDVFYNMLSALTQWKHRPRLFQLVIFSMGRNTNCGPTKGEHLLVTDQLRATASDLGAVLDLSELLRPLSLREYLVLNFEGGPHAAGGQWLKRMDTEGFGKLHLLFANLYNSSDSRSDRLIRWTPHEDNPLEDECFLWPLASPKRRFSGSYQVSKSDLYERHLEALTKARESKITAEEVDLRLDDIQVQDYLQKLLRDESVFGRTAPFLVVDLRKDSSGHPVIKGILTLSREGTTWSNVSGLDELQVLTADLFGDRIGVAACTVLPNEPFLERSVDAGNLSEVLAASVAIPENAVQRFFAISSPAICLSTPRQRIFLSVLSELAVRAKVLAHQRAVELEQFVRSQLNGLLHTALNTLRSVQAGVACKTFGDGAPPRKLTCQVGPTGTDVLLTAPVLETKLLETLNRIWTGEEAAAGAISFARILAGGGRIPEKQLAIAIAKKEYTLTDAAKHAERILSGYAISDPTKEFTIVRDDASLDQMLFPDGYMQKELLAIVIYELLLNGYMHAAKPILLRLRAKEAEKGITLTVSSKLQAEDGSTSSWVTHEGITLRAQTWERKNSKDSFLFRFQNISKALDAGLSITTAVVTHDDCLWHEATLYCGKLASESGSSARPIWKEGMP